MNDDITTRAFWNEKRVTEVIYGMNEKPFALAELTLEYDPCLKAIHEETIKTLRSVK